MVDCLSLVNRSIVGEESRLKSRIANVCFATMASHSNQDHEMAPQWNDSEQGKKELADVDLRGVSPSEHNVATETLARKLSARQVQMIAIGGEYYMLYSHADHHRSVLTLT